MCSSPDPPDPAHLERALRRLPPRQREAFLLKARDGLTYAEIAGRLGTSPKAVEALVAAALAALAARLFAMRRRRWRRP